ncbi:FG-GAP repeat protein [Streptomyces minutiscleroticus]|uniref:FG-GAP repeat protein n=1 Tax=Streptomyces minutiscleroticus TaxID=68238 RepID=UPI001E5D5FA9|nr:FG-GAP repeat protein [Streptomyces minutiscleroticus]
MRGLSSCRAVLGAGGGRCGVVLREGPFTRAGGHSGWQPLGEDHGYLSASQPAAGRVTADAATDLYVLGEDLGDDDQDMRAFFHRGGTDVARVAGAVRVPDDGGHQVGGGPVTAVADFDKDGYGDLAIGRGQEQPDGARGYVTVQYGGAAGPDTAREPVRFTQDTAGVPGASEEGDRFGAAVAAGDVDGDGYADLAVGSPGEDLADKRDGGMVTVLLGRAGGLSGSGAKAYDQNTSGAAGAIENDDLFGLNLKFADFLHLARRSLPPVTRRSLPHDPVVRPPARPPACPSGRTTGRRTRPLHRPYARSTSHVRRAALGRAPVLCHDRVVADVSKILNRADLLLDLLGPVVGAVLLMTGVDTYRDGGSMAWPLMGAVLLLGSLWVLLRRVRSRRGRPGPSA